MSLTSVMEYRTQEFEPRNLYPTHNMNETKLQHFNEILERHIPHVLGERIIDIGECDKVFASLWLSEDFILLGTKSNELLAVDITTNTVFNIPLLKNSGSECVLDVAGVHCMELSDDGRYVCTGGANPNELAVYKLPEMTPYVLGQGHSDWIFDVTWLSEDIILSGSRDSSMGVWKLTHNVYNEVNDYNYPMAECVPTMRMMFGFSNNREGHSHGSKVRSLAINKDSGILASLQSSVCDASLHFWDRYTFQELCSVDLPYNLENVCLQVQPDYNLYAVGSRSHVSFVDGRLGNQAIGSIRSKDRDCGVRSLQFKGNIISIGSGGGSVFFYDLRFAHYLTSVDTNKDEPCCLRTSDGWVRKDTTFRDFFSNFPHPPNAIYTHKYSPSQSRLLLAGGPLPLGLYGNYCALWS